jgi:hypothetical protein
MRLRHHLSAIVSFGLSLLLLAGASAAAAPLPSGQTDLAAAPGNLRVAARSALVRLNWTAPRSSSGTVLGYAVYRSPGPAHPFELLAALPAYVLSYEDYGVTNDQAYTYTVRAFYDRKAESPGAAPATAVPRSEDLRVALYSGARSATVNGATVSLDAPAEIRVGRIMVPLRFVASSLGATVVYDSSHKEVTATLGPRVVCLWVGEAEAEIDGRTVTIAAPPVLEHGRTLVPLRFLSEAFGARVDFQKASGLAQITLPDTDSSPAGAKTELRAGTSLRAALSGPGDVDVYRCPVIPGRTYRAVAARPHPGQAVVLSAVDPGQSPPSVELSPAPRPTDGGHLAELETTIAPGKSSLYVRVQASDPGDRSASGAYTITLTDTTEPQDTPAGAVWLAAGNEAGPGYLHHSTDTDYFRFEAALGQTYAITVAPGNEEAAAEEAPSSFFEALVTLSGPDGLTVMRETSTEAALRSQPVRLLFECSQAGPHVVKVASLDNRWGAYTIGVSPATPEPQEGPQTAEILRPDHDARPGWLPSVKDEDWFAFPAERGKGYFVQTLNLSAGCDTVLTLYGYGGEELAANNDGMGRSWPDAGSLIALNAVYDGLVYARVTPFVPAGQAAPGLGGYTFTVTTTGPETDGRPGQAIALAPDHPETRSLVTGDRDWFTFRASAGALYVLETSALSAGCDTDLAVYDEHGQLLAANDDVGDAPASRVEFAATSDGPLWACVTPIFIPEMGDGTGTYTITLDLGLRPSN